MQVEQWPHQPGGQFGQEDRSRRGRSLKAGRRVYRVPQGVVGHLQHVRDLGEHDRTGVHSDTHLDRRAVCRLDLFGEPYHGVPDVQGRVHRPFRIVLMSQRCSEECQQTIPHHLRHRALIVCSGGDDAAQKLVHNHLEPLRAEPLAQRGRAGDIAEQHCDDTPLLTDPRSKDLLSGFGRNERTQVLAAVGGQIAHDSESLTEADVLPSLNGPEGVACGSLQLSNRKDGPPAPSLSQGLWRASPDPDRDGVR